MRDFLFNVLVKTAGVLLVLAGLLWVNHPEGNPRSTPVPPISRDKEDEKSPKTGKKSDVAEEK